MTDSVRLPNVIQRELHSQREGLDQQRDRLEQERRELASSRYWESLLGEVIRNLGLIILCLLPLTICWLLLRQTSEPVSDQEVAELLLNDLTSDDHSNRGPRSTGLTKRL